MENTLEIVEDTPEEEEDVLCNECQEVLGSGTSHTDCVHLCKGCYTLMQEDSDWCSSYR